MFTVQIEFSSFPTGVSNHWTGFSTGTWDRNLGLDWTGLTKLLENALFSQGQKLECK